MKNLKTAACVLLGALAVAGCSDDNATPTAPKPVPTGARGAYVLNQGNSATSPDGTLDFIDFADGTYTDKVFYKANGRMLGDTPQDGLVYGGKIYIVAYGSDIVWALDAATHRCVGEVRVNKPESLCADGGYVYVSENDGNVAKIDTLDFSVKARVAVGPNPAQLTSVGGFLYVSVSDGYNFLNNYANGLRVAKIDLSTFTKQTDIAVGLNPGPIVASADGTVFVVARGDYYTMAPTVQKISQDGTVENFCPGSHIAIRGTTLYVINNTFVPAGTPVSFSTYDTRSGELLKAELLPADARPPFPIDIDVNPADGDIYIGSDPAGDYGYADYTAPGSVFRYTADGTFVGRYAAGVHPCAVFFK